MTTFSIYRYLDPRDNTVRYVGCTEHDPRRHMRDYMDRATRGFYHGRTKPSSRPLHVWMRQLAFAGLKPIVETIETFTYEPAWVGQSIALHRENLWIEYYIRVGAPMTNVQRGAYLRQMTGPFAQPPRAWVVPSARRQVAS